MTANILLDVQHVSVEYGMESEPVHAVADVSFTLRRGEVMGLAGESGSGKSTLAYAIARLLPPTAAIMSGRVLYYPRPSVNSSGDGSEAMDVLALSPEELRTFRWNDLAIVFQSAMNALNPVMTVGAQIDDVLRTHRSEMGATERRQRAIDLLRLVGIASDRLKSFPHELSGGMRQRAIIAIALALSPDLIIMDEPTTALDVVVQREILTEIARLRQQLGFSVIFITHDLSLLLEIADRVAIMYAGRLVEATTARELHRRPRHPYSYGMLHAFPALRGPRRPMLGIPGSPPDLRAVPSGCPFHPRCPLAFAACPLYVPPLRPPEAENPEVAVACHLYDPTYAVAPPPTDADLAAAYAAIAASFER
jgi:peptide/nickel transport system ATP-binding protein